MSVKETAAKIKSMETRGALKIAVAAAKALEQEIMDGASYDSLLASGDILRDARPTAVSLPNAINYVLHLAQEHEHDDPAVARPMLLADVSDYISRLETSKEKVAEIGSGLVEDGDVILTICNSDTVVSVLKRAHKQGKRFSVYACETRPRLQGHITARALQAAGVDVTLIVDSAAYYTAKSKGVKKVMVGADTVYGSGEVINKIGTSQVALIAKTLGLPVIVCTESIKLSPYSLQGAYVEIEERDSSEVAELPGIRIFNPAFDITRAEDITTIITEYGLTTPAEISKLIEEKFAWALK